MGLVHFVIGRASGLSPASAPSTMLGDHWLDYRLFFGSDEHPPLPDEEASSNPLRRDDWLLPAIAEPMSEADMYEKLLTKSNSSYMWAVTFEEAAAAATAAAAAASRPVNNVQARQIHKNLQTISLSQVLSQACEDKAAGDYLGHHADAQQEPVENVCEHCNTTQTPLWRRVQGRITCNACALYEKLHGKPRPVHLLHHTIRRRNRRGGHSRRVSKDTDKACCVGRRGII